MIEVVTLLTEAHKIIIIESQLRELLEVLDVVYRRRWSLTSVPPTPHTHIPVPAQYRCAFRFPYRACIEFIHSIMRLLRRGWRSPQPGNVGGKAEATEQPRC